MASYRDSSYAEITKGKSIDTHYEVTNNGRILLADTHYEVTNNGR